jgi:hypothetical protein
VVKQDGQAVNTRGVELSTIDKGSTRLLVGHEVQCQCRQIVALLQCCDLGLLDLAYNLSVGSDKTPDSSIRHELRFLGLPAEQARHGCEWQFLWQQTSPLLEATRHECHYGEGAQHCWAAREFVSLDARIPAATTSARVPSG